MHKWVKIRKKVQLFIGNVERLKLKILREILSFLRPLRVRSHYKFVKKILKTELTFAMMGQTVQLIMSGQNSTFLDSKAYHIHALMSHGYMRGGRFIYSCESYIFF